MKGGKGKSFLVGFFLPRQTRRLTYLAYGQVTNYAPILKKNLLHILQYAESDLNINYKKVSSKYVPNNYPQIFNLMRKT